MADTTAAVEYRDAAVVEVRGSDDAPRIYLRAIVAGEQSADRSEVFDVLPEQPEGGVVLGRCHPAGEGAHLARPARRTGRRADSRLRDTRHDRGARPGARSAERPPADGLNRVSRAGRSRRRRRAADRPVGPDWPGCRPVGLLPKRNRRSPTPAPAPRAVVADGRPDNRHHHSPSARRG